MHIELDVIELLVIVLGYFLIKWGFRFTILIGIVAVTKQMKERGEKKLNEWGESVKSAVNEDQGKE